MKRKLAFLLMLGCASAGAAPESVRWNEPCNEEGLVARTTDGDVLMCQVHVFLPPFFAPSNVRLASGQTVRDEAGCLYAVTRSYPKAELMLVPSQENGKQVCSPSQQRYGFAPPMNGKLNMDAAKNLKNKTK